MLSKNSIAKKEQKETSAKRRLEIIDVEKDISSDLDLMTLDFDTKTTWKNKDKLPAWFNPEKLLENCKNPGVGLKELHKQDINGQGINVAIVDCNLSKHQEYIKKIKSVSKFGHVSKQKPGMHGASVTSILAGNNCGVAPNVDIHYAAVPEGRQEKPFIYRIQALNDIIERNKKNPEHKIKIVSCSIGYTDKDIDKVDSVKEWTETIKKAEDEGIIIVHAKNIFDMGFIGGGAFNNPDDPDDYNQWLYLNEQNPETIEATKSLIILPCDHRTTASHKSKDSYRHTGGGGISWAIPYLAGIFSLALQSNPNLTKEEIVQTIKDTATTNKKGLKIINPTEMIKSIQENIPQ